jgi:hypothetical protein
MKCCRAVLVGLVVVACVFLTGFKKPVHNKGNSNKKHHVVKASKSQQKPLDLSVPQRVVSFEVPETIAVLGNTLPVAFTPDSQKKARPIELQGKVIMSQEPEAGKIKSADGAGIVINLRP